MSAGPTGPCAAGKTGNVGSDWGLHHRFPPCPFLGSQGPKQHQRCEPTLPASMSFREYCGTADRPHSRGFTGARREKPVGRAQTHTLSPAARRELPKLALRWPHGGGGLTPQPAEAHSGRPWPGGLPGTTSPLPTPAWEHSLESCPPSRLLTPCHLPGGAFLGPSCCQEHSRCWLGPGHHSPGTGLWGHPSYTPAATSSLLGQSDSQGPLKQLSRPT